MDHPGRPISHLRPKFSSSFSPPPLAQGIAFEASKQRSLASPRYLIYTPLWEKVPGHAWAPRPGHAETRRHRSTFQRLTSSFSCSRRTLLSTTPLARPAWPFALLWCLVIRPFCRWPFSVHPVASPCKGGRRYESALWGKLAGPCRFDMENPVPDGGGEWGLVWLARGLVGRWEIWKERTLSSQWIVMRLPFDAGVSLDVLARATQWGLLLMLGARGLFFSESVARYIYPPTRPRSFARAGLVFVQVMTTLNRVKH
jgi:hypothetical protein